MTVPCSTKSQPQPDKGYLNRSVAVQKPIVARPNVRLSEPTYTRSKRCSCPLASELRKRGALQRTLFLFRDRRHNQYGRDRAFVLHPVRRVLAGRERFACTIFLSHIAAVVDDLAGQHVHHLRTILVAVRRVGSAR